MTRIRHEESPLERPSTAQRNMKVRQTSNCLLRYDCHRRIGRSACSCSCLKRETDRSNCSWTRCDLRRETGGTEKVSVGFTDAILFSHRWNSSFYTRLLDEQAQRLRNELTHHRSGSSIPVEQLSIGQLKDRLARVEYEHRELKQLVFDLRSDLSSIAVPQPTYRNSIRIPNFLVKP